MSNRVDGGGATSNEFDSNAADSRTNRLRNMAQLWLPSLIIVAIGLGIRASMAFTPGIGHESDLNLFASWTRQISEQGLHPFIRDARFCDYPPFLLLVFDAIGRCMKLFPQSFASGDGLFVILKIPAVIADFISVIVLHEIVRRRYGMSLARAAAALYFLNPAVFFNSSYWGQMDAIHSLFLLIAVTFAAGGKWFGAGAALGLALSQKLQSIAIVPLILFEAYRVRTWKGLGLASSGALLGFALIASPFLYHHTLDDVFRRSYVSVVGQYPELSRNAFNLWYLLGRPDSPDTSLPLPIAEIVAAGRIEFAESDSWLTLLNWRRVSLILYTLGVASIVSLYSFRPSPLNIYAAAGGLALLFFLVPTEMHERYAHPALVVLPVWAASGAWRERLYLGISALLTLNLAAVLSPDSIAPQLAGMLLLALASLIAAPLLAGEQRPRPACLDEAFSDPQAIPGLIRWFRRITCAAIGVCFAAGLLLLYRSRLAPKHISAENVLYLDATSLEANVGWGTLQHNRSIDGGLLHLGDRYYLRGLGAHAPGRIAVSPPPRFDEFAATVGINRSTRGAGSAGIRIDLDGKLVYESTRITGTDPPLQIRVPLRGAKKMTIRFDDAGDGRSSDHIVFAEARFLDVDGVDPSSLKSAE